MGLYHFPLHILVEMDYYSKFSGATPCRAIRPLHQQLRASGLMIYHILVRMAIQLGKRLTQSG